MTDAQKLIAEVVVIHELRYDDWAVKDADFYKCACGWGLSTSASVHDYAAHLSTEIDKALGGLTTQYHPPPMHFWDHETRLPGRARWVSEWRPVQP